MRVLLQLMEKKLDNERVLERAFQNFLAYQEHISCYLLALAYLEISDPDIHEKEMLWKKYVLTQKKEYYLKLLSFKPKEEYIILQAIKKMDIAKEEMAEKWGSLFGEYSWSILSYEHEEAD